MKAIFDFDWDLTRIVAVIGALTGIVGSGLGIWTRLEQMRETKRRRIAELPRFEIISSESGKDAWRRCQIEVFNPNGDRFSIDRVRSLTANLAVAPNLRIQIDPDAPAWNPGSHEEKPNLEKAGRSFDASWEIDRPKGDGLPAAWTSFWLQLSDGAELDRCVIRFECSYRHNTRAPFSVDARIVERERPPRLKRGRKMPSWGVLSERLNR